MKDYSLGKIYKIIDNTTPMFYIGSTTYPKLSQRLAKHRAHLKDYEKGYGKYMTSMEILNNDDYKIILLEDYPCDNIDQLISREQFWLDKLRCDDMINKQNAKGVNKEKRKEYNKEYKETHKEEIAQKGKEYRETHKEQIEKKAKEKIQCDRCNSIVCKYGFNRHRKRKSCINALPRGIINELAE